MSEDNATRPLTDEELANVRGGYQLPSETWTLLDAGKCAYDKSLLEGDGNPYNCKVCGHIFFRSRGIWCTTNYSFDIHKDIHKDD